MIIMACVNLSLISRVVLFCMEANVESVALLTDNPGNSSMMYMYCYYELLANMHFFCHSNGGQRAHPSEIPPQKKQLL